MPRILIVDDDPGMRSSLQDLYEDQGIEVTVAEDLAGARERLSDAAPDLLLVDVMLPDGSGLDLLEDLNGSPTRVVVITGNPDVDAAVRSLRAGAHDFLVKPFDLARARDLVRYLQPDGDMQPHASNALVGQSPAMRSVFEAIEKVGPTDATVLLVGESGTGKELVAQAIHGASKRREHQCLAVNCGALPGELIGSELFGHERGAFTGATRQHKGVFERASGGTLFLDEITEMPEELQTNLLRVLETSTFRRIGGTEDLVSDVRIIAATNQDPGQAVADGEFREDLYFRLSVFPIRLPLLRERKGDIPLLSEHVLERLNADAASDEQKRFGEGAINALERHDWPGNVRELWNVIHRAHILADTDLTQAQIERAIGAGGGVSRPGSRIGVGATIREVERKLITDTLRHFEGDKRTAAKVLGISLKTLYNRLKEYDDS